MKAEEFIAIVARTEGVTHPPKQCEDGLPHEEFRDKTILDLQGLTRKEGRTWSNQSDIKIGVSRQEFFRCDIYADEMTRDLQATILNSRDRIRCIGCYRTSNRKTPLCVGHMLRLAWHKKHPELPHFYDQFKY